MNRKGNNKNWLLIKECDAYAKPDSGGEIVEKYQTSVLSKRSLDTVARKRDRVWASKDARRGREKSNLKVQSAPLDPSEIAGPRTAPLPAKMMPQLATLVAAAPDSDDWLHEIKFDGYHMIARLDRGRVTMLSRNGSGAFGRIRYSEHIEKDGPRFTRKRAAWRSKASSRRAGMRLISLAATAIGSRYAASARAEFVIIGWTDPHGHRKGFG
jgi:ATP-dependent DNA ligase